MVMKHLLACSIRQVSMKYSLWAAEEESQGTKWQRRNFLSHKEKKLPYNTNRVSLFAADT
jgi:hypothetical protein